METWPQPRGLNALVNFVVFSVKGALLDRYVCIVRVYHRSPPLISHTSEHTTVDNIK